MGMSRRERGVGSQSGVCLCRVVFPLSVGCDDGEVCLRFVAADAEEGVVHWTLHQWDLWRRGSQGWELDMEGGLCMWDSCQLSWPIP